MPVFTQLTEGERNQIYVLHKQGTKPVVIARLLGRNRSTICRELRRNCGGRGYRPAQAHCLARARRSRASRRIKMSPPVVDHIEARLRLDWSPEQISQTMRGDVGVRMSHERIYQHVYQDRLMGGDLHTHLRRAHKKRRRRCHPANHRGRGRILNRRDISERSPLVETRLTVGHWEADTIIGAGHKGAAVTLVERATRFTLIAPVKSTGSEEVALAIITMLHAYRDIVFSITADNGKEFARHEEIAQALEADFFFARPYHSWERGTNENTNGLIRQYLPKKEALDDLDDAKVDYILDRLNNRPRKILAFNTPSGVLKANLS